MNYFLVLNFGPVTPDRQTDGQKAMHKSPLCISTGVLKKLCSRNVAFIRDGLEESLQGMVMGISFSRDGGQEVLFGE